MLNYTRIAPAAIPQQTRYQEVPLFDEGLYDLGQQTYAWMVPNGSWGEANAGLIVGDGESLLVDTLWDVAYTRQMLDAMAQLTDAAPIRTVVNTHADGDHYFGNELLKVQTITSLKALTEMAGVKPKSMILLGKMGKLHGFFGRFSQKQAKIGRYFQQMVAPYDFKAVTATLPTRTFEQALTLDVGGRVVHLIEVGPAHTQGDSMVYVPDAKILFSADILFINSTPVMWAGPVTNWLAALERILKLDVETIIPGHGPITDKNGVRAVQAYWQYVADQVGERFRAGLDAEAAARDIALSADFGRQPFANWNSPERIMTSTHTIYRHLQGITAHPTVPQLVAIMRKQAVLANDLPTAQPQIMRLAGK
ncbi:MAG TPA: MBL fold metallo-hydrolase [Anaerolineae bacterium]|nr:MBL fold metallo-hydrolase [Anaerolineae bacterium]